MSSARKRAYIHKAYAEIDHLKQKDALREFHYGVTKSLAEVLAAKVDEQQSRIKALEDALREARNWFESQAKATSKGCPSSWELMELREERDKINELIGGV